MTEQNELMMVENKSVTDFLLEYKELKEKDKTGIISMEDKELYQEYQNILSEIGGSLDFVKNSTLVFYNDCYSLACEDKREYAENVFALTAGFNKEFMSAVKEESNSPETTIVNNQMHKSAVNAPLCVNEIAKEINNVVAIKGNTIDMKDIVEKTKKIELQMEKYNIDSNDIVNSTFALMLEEKNKDNLKSIAKLEFEMPKEKALYEILQVNPDGKTESYGIVNQDEVVKAAGKLMKNNLSSQLFDNGIDKSTEIDIHILNKDTDELIEINVNEFKERLMEKTGIKENFEKAKHSAPVITTNNTNEVGTIKNGHVVVQETAHSLGDLEREMAGSSAETITNEELRFEEIVGRKITDVELIEETIKEIITEERINKEVYHEATGNIDNIDDDKQNFDDIEI